MVLFCHSISSISLELHEGCCTFPTLFDFFSLLMLLEYLLGSGLKTGDIRLDRRLLP